MLPPTKLYTRQHGLALIVVLWMLTLLMIMASSFSLTIRRETTILTGVKTLAQASALAEAGINIAILNLSTMDERTRWRSDSSVYEIQYADAPIRIRIADQSGKIDINYADLPMLKSALSGLGLEEEEHEKLAAAILDWRDPDEIVSPNGAEKEQYEKAGLNYGPANKVFESIEELQMVMGMKPEYYQHLEPLLTTYSNTNSINPAKAPREVLLTLPNASPELVDTYMQQRAENARAGLPEQAPTWAVPNANASQVYEVLAEAMPSEGMSGGISAIIKKGLPSRKGLPFAILKWQKASPDPSLFADGEENQIITPP